MRFFDKFKSKVERAVHERKPKAVKNDGEKAAKETKEAHVSAITGKTATGAHTAYRVLERPLVTEKTAVLASRGTYVFVVKPTATKLEVKQAVKELYGVRPTDVRMVNMDGKAVRFGYRFGKRKDWKKAMVTLPEGKTLPIYE